MTWVIDSEESRLTFEAKQFGLPLFGGRFERFDVAIPPNATAGRWGFDLGVAVASLDTENSARDRRLVGPAWLDATRYPDIVFRGRRVEQVAVVEGELTRVTGDLTICGTTCPVTWEFELEARAYDTTGTLGVGYTGRLELAPRKWGLPGPTIIVTVLLHLTVLAGDRIVASSGAAHSA